MAERNELVPAPDEEKQHAHEEHARDQRGRGPRARLKNVAEITAALDQLLSMVAVGLMPNDRARVLIQALRLQLDCARSGGSESPAAGGADLDAVVALMNANPELLQTLAPTMAPEFLQDLLRGLA